MHSKLNWTKDLAFSSCTKPFLRAKSRVVESAESVTIIQGPVAAFCVRTGIAFILTMFLVVSGYLLFYIV